MSSSGAGRVSSDEIRQAQEALQDQGLYHGQVDGKWGPQTKNAIAQFQKQKGLKQTAQLDQQTMNDLQNSSGGSSGSMSNAPSGRSSGSSSGGGAGMSGGGTSGMTRGNGASTAPGNAGGANSSSMPAR
jgi:peptidoglycan hydrolase-like protein with peptidoglycan-binding domain